jgi:hypothetical protein
LFGKETEEYFEKIVSKRLPYYTISRSKKAKKVKRAFTAEPEKRLFLQGNRIIFQFPAGSRLALKMCLNLLEKALFYLKNEELVQKDTRDRSLATAAYSEVNKSGRIPRFSLL